MSLITQNSKAIASFIAGYIAVILATEGIRPDMTVEEALQVGVYALLVALVTWLSPKNKV